MKRGRFNEEHIIGILKEDEVGISVADLRRKHGVQRWHTDCETICTIRRNRPETIEAY